MHDASRVRNKPAGRHKAIPEGNTSTHEGQEPEKTQKLDIKFSFKRAFGLSTKWETGNTRINTCAGSSPLDTAKTSF
jgi:hypothetical protein